MTEETRKPFRHLTEAEYAEAGTLYELGEVSLSELADRYKVTPSALKRGFDKRGIVRGSKSKDIAARTAEAAIAVAEMKAAEAARLRQERIEKVKDDHFKWLDFVNKSALQVAIKANKDGRAISTCKGDFQSLRLMAQIFTLTRDGQYHLLDLFNNPDGVDDLPVLQIHEATAEELEGIRARISSATDEDDDLELEGLEIEELEIPGDDDDAGA